MKSIHDFVGKIMVHTSKAINNHETLVGRRVWFDPGKVMCHINEQMASHDGQMCYVMSQEGNLYRIQFEDGFECDAFSHEILL